MPFLGNDDDDPLALFPQPPTETLQRHRLACTGRAADPPVAAGVLIIIIGIEKYRRAVVEVQSQKDPATPEVSALRRALRSISGSSARMGRAERNACSFL